MRKKSRDNRQKRDFKPKHKAGQKPHQRSSPAAAGPKIQANLWGVHAVREAYLNQDRAIDAVYISENGTADFEDIAGQAKGLKRPAPQVVDKKTLDASLPPGAVHQGLAVLAQPLPEMFLSDLVARCDQKESPVLLMLDQVTDPHNVGAILRTACALGADGVIMQKRHAPELTGTLAKTACGAVEHIPVVYETNLSRAIEALKDAEFLAIGFDERGESLAESLHPQNQAGRMLLVLGAEGQGLRRLVKDGCDQLLALPTQPPIQSLNVSVSAALALYHIRHLR